MTRMLREAGFAQIEHFPPEQANEAYFHGRSDGLRAPTLERLVSATRVSERHDRPRVILLSQTLAWIIAPSAGCSGTLPMNVLAISPGLCFSLSQTANIRWAIIQLPRGRTDMEFA